MRAAVSPPGPGSGARMQRSFSHGGPLMHRGHGSSSHPAAVAHRSHDVLDGGDDRVRVVQLNIVASARAHALVGICREHGELGLQGEPGVVKRVLRLLAHARHGKSTARGQHHEGKIAQLAGLGGLGADFNERLHLGVHGGQAGAGKGPVEDPWGGLTSSG